MTNYEKYQLQWMIEHGHSLSDLISELSKIRAKNPGIKLKKTFEQWEYEVGFSGEIWACKDEWEDYESCGKNADDPYIENNNAFTAKWIDDGFAIYCSNCKEYTHEDSDWGFQKFDHCPNCGAKME